VSILRRSHCVGENGKYSFAIPAATIEAFNAWRRAEHNARIAQPERYGVDDPLAKAPEPAVRGDYVFGEFRWVRL
jgi:hypothetical protein